MKIVGVTGGIGSGKSVVCRIFETLGIPVFDSDAVAKCIIADDERVREQIKLLLGQNVYNGPVPDRGAIAAQVFNDPQKLKALNAIIHPKVAEAFEGWKSGQQAPYVIREAAILFESGAHVSTDVVITVSAPEALRISRVTARDGRSEAAIRNIMSRQLTDEERKAKSDFELLNDDQTAVLPQVLRLHELLSK
ncbi:MAG TPA: dephospho-CoA kinase [Bacteroidia bacterium]|nr:dephospho-CoA kinase [Bacteroidia bacterium]